ncbi:MAG: secondary thiamine-phosphate synthase enzyme YjbQ [Thermodesulfobacteriota bacterium]
MSKGSFAVATHHQVEMVDISARLEKELAAAGIQDGVLVVYNPHTTAGLTINEGADPAVQADIIAVLELMVPRSLGYRHQEGNSPAHVKASLMGATVTVFVENGRLALGTWQRVFFCEFDGPRSRRVHWRLAG